MHFACYIASAVRVVQNALGRPASQPITFFLGTSGSCLQLRLLDRTKIMSRPALEAVPAGFHWEGPRVTRRSVVYAAYTLLNVLPLPRRGLFTTTSREPVEEQFASSPAQAARYVRSLGGR